MAEFFGEIYRVTNLVNKKIYIGKTSIGHKRRWRQHKSNAFSPSLRLEHYLYRAMRKYGIDNFAIEVIDISDSEDSLHDKERAWIQSLNSFNAKVGYNCTAGGDGMSRVSGRKSGRKLTPEQCAAISARQKGKKQDPDHIRRMVEARLAKFKETPEQAIARGEKTKLWWTAERKKAHGEKIRARYAPERIREIDELKARRFEYRRNRKSYWTSASHPVWTEESRRKRGEAARIWWQNHPEAKERNSRTSEEKRIKCAAAARKRWDKVAQIGG